jgi:Domain of unknown function (DUF1905)/Bacteriocin-protection, YdeI or OmpD-Associated
MARFEAVLQPDPTGTGTFIRVPRELNAKLGLQGRPKVRAVLAGHPYRGSLMPAGDGTFVLGVLKAIQESARVTRGDRIAVELELDTAPREIEPPPEIARLLARDRKAAAAWDKLSYTNKRELANAIAEAKRPETRERRVAIAIERLRA